MKMMGTTLTLVLTLACVTAVYAAGPWAGFESGKGTWIFPDKSWEGNNTSGLEASTEYASEGKSSLKLSFTGAGFRAIGFVEGEWDMTKVSKIGLDLYNPTEDGGVAIAICTGDSWFWQESTPVPVKNGWNKSVAFDLTKATWKSAASGWAFSAKPNGLKSVKRFVVVFFEGKTKAGAVYLDNINIDGLVAGAAPKPAAVEQAIVNPVVGQVNLIESKVPALGSNYGFKMAPVFAAAADEKKDTKPLGKDVVYSGSATVEPSSLDQKNDDETFLKLAGDITAKNELGEIYLNAIYDNLWYGEAREGFELRRGHIASNGFKVFRGEAFVSSNDLGDPFKLFYHEKKIDSEYIYYQGLSYQNTFGNLGVYGLYLPDGRDSANPGSGDGSADWADEAQPLTGARLTYALAKSSIGLTYASSATNSTTQNADEHSIIATDVYFPLPVKQLGALKLGYGEDSIDAEDSSAFTAIWQNVNVGPLWFYFEYLDGNEGFNSTGGEWNMNNAIKRYGNVFWQPLKWMSLKLAYDGYVAKNGSYEKAQRILTSTISLAPFTISTEYMTCPINDENRVGLKVEYGKDKLKAMALWEDLNDKNDKSFINRIVELKYDLGNKRSISASYGHYGYRSRNDTSISNVWWYDFERERLELAYTTPIFDVWELKAGLKTCEKIDKSEDDTLIYAAMKYTF